MKECLETVPLNGTKSELSPDGGIYSPFIAIPRIKFFIFPEQSDQPGSRRFVELFKKGCFAVIKRFVKSR